jgi:hypothetical protein
MNPKLTKGLLLAAAIVLSIGLIALVYFISTTNFCFA